MEKKQGGGGGGGWGGGGGGDAYQRSVRIITRRFHEEALVAWEGYIVTGKVNLDALIVFRDPVVLAVVRGQSHVEVVPGWVRGWVGISDSLVGKEGNQNILRRKIF
jgi:hypothetical protein